MGAQGTRAVDAARRAGIPHTVHEYAHDERASLQAGGRGYALEAVEALGLDAARVFKTIVVGVDGRLGLVVVPADADVDLKAAADALGGRRAAIADPAEAERATGYVRGGISPLGTRRPMPVVLDASAADHPTIHLSAGRRGLQIELAADDLVRATKARLAPVARRR
jgi:Cys-tRNA(Pro)/Cys-tRNA(Cys) deacylase